MTMLKQIGAMMSKWIGLTVLAVTLMALGCSQQPSGTAAVIEDKTYTVTPASVKVKAGIVTGEVTEMKVTERVSSSRGRGPSRPSSSKP